MTEFEKYCDTIKLPVEIQNNRSCFYDCLSKVIDQLEKESTWIFRGQKNSAWPLETTLERRLN